MVAHREPIEEIKQHFFGEASGPGTPAAVYGVSRQASGTSQGLVTAKPRLAKKGHTDPRLEFLAAHMAANVVDNARRALVDSPVSLVQYWTDSTVALHWIGETGEYRQFVAY